MDGQNKEPILLKSKPAAGVHRGDLVELRPTDLALGGAAVARLDDLVVFVENALPGQTVLAKIFKKKKNFAEARLEKVLTPAPGQVEPRCAHFGHCGGCRWQHFAYGQQLESKQRQVEETLRHLGGFAGLTVQPTLPSPEIYGYRNKMEFSFSPLRWLPFFEKGREDATAEALYLGLHAKGFFDKIIDVESCHLLPPLSSEILQEVRQFAIESGRPAYHARDHRGFWRFLVVRHARKTGELMVNLVASEYDRSLAETFTQRMQARFPQISSLLYSTTQSLSGVAFSEAEYLLAGKSTITENLGSLSFEISSNSFFQTNTLQAERLYDVIIDYAQLRPDETVYDLYCGAGTISLYVSHLAERVVGFESVKAAVDDAHHNAAHNRIGNCFFVWGDLRDALEDTGKTIARYGRPDVLIIDPPRGGMHPKTVAAVLRLAPQRIVHVSCNPATLARDLKLLCAEAYRLTKVQPVDMFPHTAHIEVVVLLQRNPSSAQDATV
ncbi:MAG TPA: 23S rRNA (uracil(1939)-C(5))-methyltransferase RlmD [bacterium]|nr:23S rRNA (uracil(1939)-C(5))-methyltransferase RlmD [bacterium]HPG83445.1 23S rRNA (uracil(1939)-C(5))-methyltransferase RlmD [bacterium]HPM58971.1 23S rRNA (uracil(1939)-C(5))-methyltransferase RlmD [bacterium]